MNMNMEIVDWWKERIKQQKYPSDYGGQDFWEDDGWLLTVSWNPTQSKIDEIAYDMLSSDIQECDADNFDEVRFNHWACGYVRQLYIRPIDKNDRLTEAGKLVYDYIEDCGEDYFHRASESDEYFEWEREMVKMCIENDELDDEQMEELVSHLLCECNLEVSGDGSVWLNDVNIDEEIDYLFGDSDKAQQRRAAEHPNQTRLDGFTQEE